MSVRGRMISTLRRSMGCEAKRLFFTTSPVVRSRVSSAALFPSSPCLRRRTSWKLPDVRQPGGHQCTAATLAALDAALGRRTDPIFRAGPILAHHQLGGYQVGSSNAAGMLAQLKQVSQDPTFTPPHRRPGFSSQQQYMVSRPGGVSSALVQGDGKGGGRGNRRDSTTATWHMKSLVERRMEKRGRRGDDGSRGKTLNVRAFRQWYRDS